MGSLYRYAFVAAALSLSTAAAVACSSSTGAESQDDSEGLTILFPTAYSAYDGQRDFKVPATVTGVKNVKWSASDPSMVDLEPGTDGSSVTIITKKAGTVTIIAKSGSLVGHAPLTITQAADDDWDTGNQRYNDGVVLSHHGDGGRPEAGAGGGGGGGGFQVDTQAACTNCHGDNSKMDVQHTPTQTAGYSDQDLINIFTTGTKPPGVGQRIMPFDQWHKIHQWAMPSDSQQGLVVYLRSLEPKSQGPTTDFGGRGGGGSKDGGSGGGH